MVQAVKGYCMRCKKMVPMHDGRLVKKSNKKGRTITMMKATCGKCGTSVWRIMANDSSVKKRVVKRKVGRPRMY